MEIKSSYIKSVLTYLIMFFLMSQVIALLLTSTLTEAFNIDIDLYIEVAQSGDLLSYINTDYHDVVLLIFDVNSITNFITYFVALVLLIIFLKEDLVTDFNIIRETQNNKVFTYLKKVLIWFFVFYGLTIVSNIIISTLENYYNLSNSENQKIIEMLLTYSPLPMIIATTILGPIVEELIFRKTIFGLIENKINALIVSSFVFALIHMISSLSAGYNMIELIVLTLPYLSAGFILGYIYIKTNLNIYYVTAIHMLTNIISVILILCI